MPPSTTFIRDENDDPMAPGTKMAPSLGFRTMGAEGQLGSPRLSTDFQAWELGDRLIRKDGKRDWRMGIRLGTQIGGAGANTATYVQSAPAAHCKTTVRKMVTFASAPGQAGLPPTIDTDAVDRFIMHGLRKCSGSNEPPPSGESCACSIGGNNLPTPLGRQIGHCATRGSRPMPVLHARGARGNPGDICVERVPFLEGPRAFTSETLSVSGPSSSRSPSLRQIFC